MTTPAREWTVKNAREKDFCLYCGAKGIPLQKMVFFDSCICKTGFGCQGEFKATAKQAATSLLLIVAVISVFVPVVVVTAYIVWLWLTI